MESVKRILVIGSGAVKIAEAAEFDYSGNQALKAFKEEGLDVVLISPNVASVQTSYKFADRVYMAPLTVDHVVKVIERERPDAIAIGFGGQTALSVGVRLHDGGHLSKYSVKVLGTPIEGVKASLSREMFKDLMRTHGIPVPPSGSAREAEEAFEIAEKIGYPVMVRVSFNLGGAGSFVARSDRELEEGLRRALSQSEIGEVLIERYLDGWKEIEFEVVRDAYDNVAAVVCMENLDPMGVHTGESIVVAPCQTLSDEVYQSSRDISIAVERAIRLIGEGNVQVAIEPSGGQMYAIETNPRMSRSSALASKASGYPLAYVAAKLALGYKLHEIVNKVTGSTYSMFEPSLDYVVVKIPRWDLDKFEGSERSIGSEMKSVGEVMAIGRNLVEAMQKAIRMLDIGEPGLVGGPSYETGGVEEVMKRLTSREPYWPLYVARALRLGISAEEISRAIHIDLYFIRQIEEAVKLYEELRATKSLELIGEAKRLGFSDSQIAAALGIEEEEVRRLRSERRLRPVVKQIDTLAAEWPANTNYLYLTYDGQESDVAGIGERGIIVLGAGVFRIGVSLEFDWGVISFTERAKELGFKPIVINYNPETVSTDWDMVDRLYFDEISAETIEEIYRIERPLGVVAFLGGQISNSVAPTLAERGIRLLGTAASSVDSAENREKFSELLETLGIPQPPWLSAESVEEAVRGAEDLGYPVLVRPSYVLSGTAMKIAHDEGELRRYLLAATRVSPRYPVVISKFVEDAVEVEVDAVSDGKRTVGAMFEHIEPAGVHSGDATSVIPPRTARGFARRAAEIAWSLSEALKIRGPFNVQMLAKDGQLYVIELNLRASRSMPFVSKSLGLNLISMAADAALLGEIRGWEEGVSILFPSWYGVKSPQFSWTRIKGAYPSLGPEMRSVGEVAAFHEMFEKALLTSWASVSGNRVPLPGDRILIYDPTGRGRLREAALELERAGYEAITIEGMEVSGTPVRGEEAMKMMLSGSIKMLMTTGHAPERDFTIRRVAADMTIPMVLNDSLAIELSKSIRYGMDVTELRSLWQKGSVRVERYKSLRAT